MSVVSHVNFVQLAWVISPQSTHGGQHVALTIVWSPKMDSSWNFGLTIHAWECTQMFFCGRNVRWEAKKRPFGAHFGSVQNQNSVTVSTEMAFFADFSSGWPFPREKQMSFPKLPTKKIFFFSTFCTVAVCPSRHFWLRYFVPANLDFWRHFYYMESA